MSEKKEQATIDIKDKELFERLKSFSDANRISLEDIAEEALREYLAQKKDEGQPPDDDVFNPDPGA